MSRRSPICVRAIDLRRGRRPGLEAATGGLRFHDLRHSFATWLVTEGVPVNAVRKVMGHEQTTTTLDLYTHTPDDYQERVLAALDGPAAFSLRSTEEGPEEDQGDEDENGVCLREHAGARFGPQKDDPRPGGDGGRRERLWGGRAVPLSGHGGCNRRGLCGARGVRALLCLSRQIRGILGFAACRRKHAGRNPMRRVPWPATRRGLGDSRGADTGGAPHDGHRAPPDALVPD